MSEIERLFAELSPRFYHKKKCDTCNNRCSNFCPDKCLEYYKNIPNYDCDYLRDAYVLRYFPTHKAEIYKLYKCNSKKIISHISPDRIRTTFNIISLGTGPGTDLIAFCEWLKSEEIKIKNTSTIKFVRVDRKENWSNQYFKLIDIYSDLISSLNKNIQYRKIISNVFEMKHMTHDIHLASVSYLFSEIKKDSESKIKTFWDMFKKHAALKCVILINDRPETNIRNLIKLLVSFVQQDYPNSYYREYCFKRSFDSNKDIELHNDNWCGCTIPDRGRNRFKSKTTCTSYQCIIFLTK